MRQFTYVVYGQSGGDGYGTDWDVWSVAAYETQEAADLHVELLTAYREKGWELRGAEYANWRKGCPYDPNFERNLTYDCTYHVEVLPQVRHVDEFVEKHMGGG